MAKKSRRKTSKNDKAARRNNPLSYETRKDAERERNKQRSFNGRNIGPPPKVKNRRRRNRAEKDLGYYLKTYFPQTFFMPFSNDHKEVIRLCQQIIEDGGMQATAMPRGSGKTSIFERAVLWAITFGKRNFAVILGSNTEAAEEILDTIKTEILTNDLLAEDFPEICHPLRALEEIANRAKGQHIDGEHTNSIWARGKLVMPTVAGSKCSGAVIMAKGILARLRGLKIKAKSGKEMRPDLVVPDDPQTDQSARSEYQIRKRLKVLRGTVLGLAGPGEQIAAFCPCTVIEPGDLAEQLLDRERCPEWHGQKIPLMRSMPTDKKLWEQYYELRAAEMRANESHKKSTAFYRKNRKAMDAGADPTWKERHDANELSAIQHAMNLIQDRGQQAFDAEFQQSPSGASSTDISLWFLKSDIIAKKIWTPPQGETVPLWTQKITSFIDVQQRLLYWGVAAWGDGFRGHLIEYGTWPKQPSMFFRYDNARRTIPDEYPGKGIKGSITAALKALISWLSEQRYNSGVADGLHIEKLGIDSGWQPGIVHTVSREWEVPGLILPCKGVPIRAGNKPFAEYNPETGTTNGHHWRETPNKTYSSRLLHLDTNYWKTRWHQGIASAEGDPESVSLPAGYEDDNSQIIAHMRAEEPVETSGFGRTVFEWHLPPNKPDNHWFDVVVGLMAMASRVGITTGSGDQPKKSKSQKLTPSQIAAFNQRARNRRYGR